MQPEQPAQVDPRTILMDVTRLKESTANSQPVKPVEKTGLEILAETKVDLRKPRTALPIIFWIKSGGVTAPFGSLGNISVGKGKAKSKKTMFAVQLVAAALLNDSLADTIICKLPEGKRRVVWFDTEQFEDDVIATVWRSFSLAGGTIDDFDNHFEAFSLIDKSIEERIRAIEAYASLHTDIALIVIDGVRDLIKDINDSAQSHELAQYISRWRKNSFSHIHLVIHGNKGDGNARGHIGTEITNKAETVAEIIKDTIDPSISTVNPSECRRLPFEKFAFSVDDMAVPRIITSYNSAQGEKTNSRKPSDIPAGVHRKILETVFEHAEELMSGAFCSGIRIAFSGQGIELGEKMSRDFATYYTQNGYVEMKSGLTKNKIMYSLPKTPF